MADNEIRVQPDSTGKAVDTAELTDGGVLVEREITVTGDPTNAANLETVNSDGSINAKIDGSVAQPPYKYATLTTAVVAATGTFLIGVVNNSITAQPSSVLVYDGTVNQATILASIAQLGPSQVITYPAPGMPITNTFVTCVPSATGSGATTGAGIQFLYR